MSDNPLRILVLANRLPFPAKDGGAIATLAMLKAMVAAGEEVSLLSLNTRKHYADPAEAPQFFKKLALFRTIDADTGVTIWGAIKNLFSDESYHISRFRVQAFAEALSEILTGDRYDIIHIEGLHMAVYLPQLRELSNARIIIRAHNVEYMIWERLAGASQNPLKRLYVRLLAARLKNFELAVLNEADAVVPITEEDALKMAEAGIKAPMFVCPAGADMSKYPAPAELSINNMCFHLGALDWMPNKQGIDWFVKEVWPRLRALVPDMQLHLAGRHFPKNTQAWNKPGIIIHGEVDNAAQFMKTHGIMIVPLLSGSGMRIKILEGLALGLPMVSTTIGAEGIAAKHENHIWIADTPEAFAEGIARLAGDEALRNQLSRNARELAEEHYDLRQITAHLMACYRTLRVARR